MLMVPLAFAFSVSEPMNHDAPGGLYYRSSGVGETVAVPHPVAHRGEFVDCLSPNITTGYSEVFWTRMASVPLPANLVSRFKGKTMAITGYEVDTIRLLPDGSTEHVPIYDEYNHHHAAWIVGAAATVVDLGHAAHAHASTTHHGNRWAVVDKPRTTSERAAAARGAELRDGEGNLREGNLRASPNSAYLVDGNGGEYRMTLHGTHRGTAMLVDSPSTFEITPMMINTQDPAGKSPGSWDLIPSGAYGRSRGATPPTNAAGQPRSLYNPMLECPCTDRKTKVVSQHNTIETGYCAARLPTAAACFAAINALGLFPMVSNATAPSLTSPAGCFVTATKDGYEAVFNPTSASTATCGKPSCPASGSGGRSTGSRTVAGVDVTLDLDGVAGKCTPATADLTGQWSCTDSFGCPAGSPYPVVISAVPARPGFYKIQTGQGGGVAGEGELVGSTVVFGPWSGSMDNYPNATISVDHTTWTFSNGVVWKRPAEACAGRATITLTGPANVWFGTGFDARSMADAYAIIVDGNGTVTERQLGNGAGIAGQHQPGTLLTPSVTVVSTSVVASRRTVVLARALKGATPAHASFSASDGGTGVPIIAAVGSTPGLSYHQFRAADDLMLVQTGGPMCVCEGYGSSSGSIDGVPFGNVCPPALANDHQGKAPGNDVCDITTYEGGLKCCHHGSILLDKNQTAPAIKDTFQMKFRVYFEEYTNQTEAFFMFQAIDAGGEYDVPQADPSTPPEHRVHTLSQDFTVHSTLGGITPPTPTSEVLLLRASTHCHAPSCINETLWNLDTNEVICYNAPLYGTGNYPSDGQSFNEPAYAAGIPPCFWGDPAEGLPAPPQLRLTTKLRSVKNCNSTHYHFGVMAQWQMRGTWA